MTLFPSKANSSLCPGNCQKSCHSCVHYLRMCGFHLWWSFCYCRTSCYWAESVVLYLYHAARCQCDETERWNANGLSLRISRIINQRDLHMRTVWRQSHLHSKSKDADASPLSDNIWHWHKHRECSIVSAPCSKMSMWWNRTLKCKIFFNLYFQ